MTEKRVLVAALLSSLFLSWYARAIMHWGPRPPQAQPAAISKTQAAQAPSNSQPNSAELSNIYHIENEEVVILESQDLAVEIGSRSCAIRQATLKQFLDSSGRQPLRISSSLPFFAFSVGASSLNCHPDNQSQDTVTLEAEDRAGNSYHIVYSLDEYKPLIRFMLTTEVARTNLNENGVVFFSAWTKADDLNDRYNRLEALVLEERTDKKQAYKRYFPMLTGEKNVPRGTSLFSLAERYFCQAVRWDNGPASVKLLASPHGTILLSSAGAPSYSG